jgi:hypothetical protein
MKTVQVEGEKDAEGRLRGKEAVWLARRAEALKIGLSDWFRTASLLALPLNPFRIQCVS